MNPADQLLILGASSRAAAFSALRSGLRPSCVDLFADIDLRLRCPCKQLAGRDYPQGFIQAAADAPPGPWLYTGGLENRPALVEQLARRRPLWGNGAAVLRKVRSPFRLCRILRAADIPCPAVRVVNGAIRPSGRWLVKPRAGAGGSGIRFWDGLSLPATAAKQLFLQEYLEGLACAALYVGGGTEARLLGVTHQLIGQDWLHAGPFRYCGSIGPMPLTAAAEQAFERLGNLLAREIGLRGIFGVDCILRDDVPWPVEVNPRYTASVEILEYAGGIPSLALHRQAYDGAVPCAPPPSPTTDREWLGKAILFAREALTFPAAGPWRAVLAQLADVREMPAFADIPPAGQRIAAGRPILTFFARGSSMAACGETLRQTASALDRWLFR